MGPHVREIAMLLKRALGEASRHPSLAIPAAVLLLPTLVLQLAVPGLLRTRLAPSIWTVVVGSLLIAWLTQVATMASHALVDARRRGHRVSAWRTARVAMAGGSVVWLGLLAGVLPGLWAQARYAFSPLDGESEAGPRARLRRSARQTRPMLVALSALTLTALTVSLLGQSLAAGLAEAAGTIVSTGGTGGRMTFRLAYVPHALTTLLAYGFVVASVALQSIGVSLCRDRLEGTSLSPMEPGVTAGWPMTARAIGWSGGLVMVAGLIAAVYKVRQHL
jgi:hypothetical protein